MTDFDLDEVTTPRDKSSRRGSADFSNGVLPPRSHRGTLDGSEGAGLVGGAARSRRNSLGLSSPELGGVGDSPSRSRRMSKGNVMESLDGVQDSPGSRAGSRAGSRRGSFSSEAGGDGGAMGGLSVNNQAKNEVINFINFMSVETAKLEAEQRAREEAEGPKYGNGASTAAEAFSKFNFREASGPQMTGKGQTLDAPEKREAANKMKRQKAYSKQVSMYV